MSFIRLAVVGAAAFALASPAAAEAGTVSGSAGVSNTYQGTDDPEEVTVSTLGAKTSFAAPATLGGIGPCAPNPDNGVDCDTAPATIVNGLGADDRIDASRLTAATNLQADGGAGGDYILDGAGADNLSGGPGGDVFIAGTGPDTISGGDGDDTVDYSGRTGAVAIRLDGSAMSGEAGEGDVIGADVESAYGGGGNDSLVANPAGGRYYGNGGNDALTGGAGEDRLEGNEGDDTIDARDGRFDSIDCGPGTDTLLADAGDTAVNCEIAPDRDGDGTLNEQDCAPDNAAIHPAAGEIVGNAVDEDCKGGPQYLRVSASLSYSTARRGNTAKFTKLTVNEIKAGDTIEIRCTGGKSKACPFTKKSQTGKAGKAKVNLLQLMKKRYLKRNAVLEVRVTRPNEIGRVLRLKVGNRGTIKSEPLCLPVGATKPAKCA
jgi:Ca2+-binding RTX toxin-like protein